jgi:hypothetical protein
MWTVTIPRPFKIPELRSQVIPKKLTRDVFIKQVRTNIFFLIASISSWCIHQFEVGWWIDTIRLTLISHRSRLSQPRQTPADSSDWLNIATQGNVISFILHASRQVLYATSQVVTGQDSSGWISCQSSCVHSSHALYSVSFVTYCYNMDVEKLIILVRSRREIYDAKDSNHRNKEINLETDVWKYQMHLASC